MDGFLNINKPKGFTSHDVVELVRRRFGQIRVGHLGTLDPLARGVLPLALGRATKLSSRLIEGEKEYEGYLLLGVQTDTQDIEGKVSSLSEIPETTHQQLEEILQRFHGQQEQLTPMFSARRHKGKRLFEFARRGQVIKRSPRKINVYRFELLSLELPRIRFFIHCSKGTYVRTLVYDLGRMIGCGACLLDLVRLRKGPFVFSESISLNRLTDLNKLKNYIIPEQKILAQIN